MKNIKFQFHITINDLNLDQKYKFINLCNKLNIKPLIIALSSGNHINQPMFTKIVHSSSFSNAMNELTPLLKIFEENGFGIIRKKAEISPEDSEYFENNSNFNPYYEWHGRISNSQLKHVYNLLKDHVVHVSENSLEGNEDFKYITIREYQGKNKFYERIKNLINELNLYNVKLIKEKYEYCIYDSMEDLDSGWTN